MTKREKLLEKTLWRLYAPAHIAVNQIICMGGKNICQPCENREELALALKATEIVLKVKIPKTYAQWKKQKDSQTLPPGWDEGRVKRVIRHYEEKKKNARKKRNLKK